ISIGDGGTKSRSFESDLIVSGRQIVGSIVATRASRNLRGEPGILIRDSNDRIRNDSVAAVFNRPEYMSAYSLAKSHRYDCQQTNVNMSTRRAVRSGFVTVPPYRSLHIPTCDFELMQVHSQEKFCSKG